MRLLLLLSLCSLSAQADTLSNLKTSLARLQADAPLRGQLQVRSENRSNEGSEDAQQKQGLAQLGLEDGPQGLRVVYPQVLMDKAAQEELAKRRNPKAPTPTAIGLDAVDYRELRDMTRAASYLERLLATAQFKGEREQAWQGQPARLLSFQLPQTEPNKYVKDFQSTLELWVSPEGVPLAARSNTRISGRAYVLISFEMFSEDEWQFAISGERLVATRRVSKGGGSGGGEKGSTSKTLSLQLG